MTSDLSRRAALSLLGAAPLVATGVVSARADTSLEAKIQAIINRPEFRDAHWAMEFYAPATHNRIYALNPDQARVAASTIKVFIAGTAFDKLGQDYRFHTRVYRTGPVVRGVLKGDLVLVASGDLLIGGRMRRDGSLVLGETDHSYDQFPGAGPVPGDPLQTIRDIAGQVAARGVRHIEGNVLVDASLFREAKEPIASNIAPITVSPMMINDNLIDVTVKPSNAGTTAEIQVSPRTAYVTVLNEVTTIPAGATPRPLNFVDDVSNPDGTRTVRLTGDIPANIPSLFRVYYIPEPVRFAQQTLTEALRDKGVSVRTDLLATADPTVLARHYTPRNRLAEHVSPPLSESVKVMLKLSSNIHTAVFPYLVGAIAGREPNNPKVVYEGYRRELFSQAGIEPDPPGASDGRFTSDTFVAFLAHIARQRYFRAFRLALPIMGKDGNLTRVQANSPAAGHVFAKTGTAVMFAPGSPTQLYKALAGYIQLCDGQWLTFAQFMDRLVPPTEDGLQVADRALHAMGEIASAVYENR